MREIVSLHVGQCGTQVGAKFWEEIAQEHALDAQGNYTGGEDIVRRQKINVFFKEEQSSGRYAPRAVFADLEPGTIEKVRSNATIGQMLQPENAISGYGTGTKNNFAVGRSSPMVEEVMDMIRLETERADSVEGFSHTSALGGGTGSGLSYQLMD